jgi:hypothetical protein
VPRPGVPAKLVTYDVNGDVAAVLMISGGHRLGPRVFSCLYELAPAGWQSLGAGSMPAERGFLRGRPSAARSGPASLLVTRGASVSRSHRWPGGSSHEDGPDPGWAASEAFRVAGEVAPVTADGRTIPVPGHGYIVVTWRSSSSFAASSRPMISCLDRAGAVLTGLAPGEHVDSGTLAGL